MNPNDMLLSAQTINRFVINLPARLQPASRNLLLSNQTHNTNKNKVHLTLPKRNNDTQLEPLSCARVTLRISPPSSQQIGKQQQHHKIKNKLHKKDIKVNAKVPIREKSPPRPLKRKIPPYFSVDAKNITAIHSIHVRQACQDPINSLIRQRSDQKVLALAIELKSLFNSKGNFSILKKIRDWSQRETHENESRIKASGIAISSIIKEQIKPTRTHNMRFTTRKRVYTEPRRRQDREIKAENVLHRSMQSDIEWTGSQDPVADWYNSTFSISLG